MKILQQHFRKLRRWLCVDLLRRRYRCHCNYLAVCLNPSKSYVREREREREEKRGEGVQ
jgi:hypothetical protein